MLLRHIRRSPLNNFCTAPKGTKFSQQLGLSSQLQLVKSNALKIQRNYSLILSMGLGASICFLLVSLMVCGFNKSFRTNLQLRWLRLNTNMDDEEQLKLFVSRLKTAVQTHRADNYALLSELQHCVRHMQRCGRIAEFAEAVQMFQESNVRCERSAEYMEMCVRILEEGEEADFSCVADHLLKHGSVKQMYVAGKHVQAKKGAVEHREQYAQNYRRQVEKEKLYFQGIAKCRDLEEMPQMGFKIQMVEKWKNVVEKMLY